MAKFDDLLATARPGLPQVPDITILSALRRVATRFFSQSGIWRQVLDPTPAKAGENEYDFNVDGGTRVEQILKAKFNGGRFDQEVPEDLFDRDSSATGSPTTFCIQSSKSTFTCWPTPDANTTGNFEFMVVVVPTRSATTIPDELLEEWYDVLVAGAKADLMRQPATPWHNAEESDRHEKFFALGMARAKAERVSGGHVDLNIKFRPAA